MRERLQVFAVGCVALAAVLGTWLTTVPASVDDSATLVNRAWVDRMPRSQKDIVTWLVPMHHKGKRFGVAQRNSHFWFAGERFTWTGQRGRLKLRFQQSGKSVTLNAKAYRCKKAGFDYCLDLKHGRKTATMYSKKDWTVPKRSAELPEMVPDRAALLATGEVPDACPSCTDGIPTVLESLFPPRN